jgi:bifunctional UDP-N-acetylglucosamine pyrophosphorylase/glucosamine-1-phosphate N-acetyltransferase
MTARAAVIMAAGQGTRMKSPVPKVLHRVGGRSLLDRVIDTVQAAGCTRIHVVVGNHSPEVRALVVSRLGEGAAVLQDPPLGTGHAVLAAREALADFDGDVLVVNGDCPLLGTPDLEPLFAIRAKGAALAIMGFEPVDPLLYGRILRGADGHVMRIVEPSQATDEVRAVKLCNGGMYVADRADLFRWLGRVKNDNPKKEYFITDIIAEATLEHAVVRANVAPETAVMGADTQMQLSQAEAIFQKRRRDQFLADGVAMPAPETVHFSWDTRIAPGATVEPYVVFGPGVTVETGAVIRAFSHLEGAVVRAGARSAPTPACGPAQTSAKAPNRQLRRGEEGQGGQGRQGQPPGLSGRRLGGAGQHRRRDDLLQLRRLLQSPTPTWARGLRRLELLAGGAGDHRRGGLCRLRLGGDQGCPPTPWP